MLPEPWNTIAFLILVPLIVQGLRLAAVKLGKPIPIAAVQAVAAVLSIVFVYLNGGFAGLEVPIFAGDPAAFIGAWLGLLLAAWGPVELLYRVFFKALFDKIGLA